MSKSSDFQSLHNQDNIFTLPNAWDVMSAMVIEQAGFKAVGTTSWGISNSFGYTDGEKLSFEDVLSLAKRMVEAVNIPVTVDIESGYGETAEAIAKNVLKLAEIGTAGINFEDSFKDKPGLVPEQDQCAVIRTIRERLDSNGYTEFFINARIDTCFQERPFEETVSRATSYVEHGANGVFVPGLSDMDQIKELVSTVPAPINILSLPNLTDVKALNDIGVKRFSIGNAISDAAIALVEQQAQKLQSETNTAFLYEGPAVTTTFR